MHTAPDTKKQSLAHLTEGDRKEVFVKRLWVECFTTLVHPSTQSSRHNFSCTFPILSFIRSAHKHLFGPYCLHSHTHKAEQSLLIRQVQWLPSVSVLVGKTEMKQIVSPKEIYHYLYRWRALWNKVCSYRLSWEVWLTSRGLRGGLCEGGKMRS